MSDDRPRQERVDAVEMQLKDAIAEDLLEMTGQEDLIVLDYVIVAEVIDKDGARDTLYTLSDNAKISSVLGWLRYATVIHETKLANNVTRIDQGE